MKIKFALVDSELENEFIRVNENDSLLEVSEKLAHREVVDLGAEQFQNSILAAYVMDGDKPIGLITKSDIDFLEYDLSVMESHKHEDEEYSKELIIKRLKGLGYIDDL